MKYAYISGSIGRWVFGGVPAHLVEEYDGLALLPLISKSHSLPLTSNFSV